MLPQSPSCRSNDILRLNPMIEKVANDIKGSIGSLVLET